MKVIVKIHVEKVPTGDEEAAFMADIQANGKLEEWRQQSEESLREQLRSEFDDPNVLDVSVAIVEDDDPEDNCMNGCGCPGDCRRAAREESEE